MKSGKGWKRPIKWVTHNFLWKVLALAGACIIWVLVASEPELSTFTTVRLEFRNLPADEDVSSLPRETVTLELHGPAGELRSLGDGRRAAVVLDLSNAKPGEKTFEIGDGNVSLPRGVTMVRSIPSEVRLQLEPRATKTVPVQVRFTGESAHGSKVAGYSVSPDKLVILGPAEHVNRISAATTDPIDVSTITGTAQIRENAYVSDPNVRFEGSPEVKVTVRMAKQ